MIDHCDKSTQDFPVKRRGRPLLGDTPLTPAQKQKRYRDRQKQLLNDLKDKLQ